MTDSGTAPPAATEDAAAAGTFPGDTEMAARCRAFDWAATPLGPVADWPQSLRTSVSLCLGSGFPMLVMWGPQLVQIYNDAFRSVLQAKHPAALGQRARDCWPELWDMIGPMYEGVLATGTSVFLEDQRFTPARRGDGAGAVEEAYFTFSYSAIRDEGARPSGILATVYETTRQVQSRSEREAALARSNERLQAAAAELQRANEELQSTAEELEERTEAAEVARAAAEQSETRFALLAQASAVLAGSLDYEATLERVAQLAVPALADWCFVDVLDEGGALRRVAVAHAEPHDPAERAVRAELARRNRRAFEHRPGDAHGVSPVFETGRPLLASSVTEALLQDLARGPEQLTLLRALRMVAYAAVPLVARGRVLGVVSFIASDGRAPYTNDDLRLFEELARRGAFAVDAARLYAAEKRVRRAAERATARAQQLQRATAALSTAVTPVEVTDVVVRHGAAALGAAAGSMVLVTSDGAALEFAHAVGYAPELVARWCRSPADAATPFADAVRHGEPVILESLAMWAELYPALAQDARATGYEALAAVPVSAGGRAVGVLGLAFVERRAFDADERLFLVSLARQAGAALERADLYQRADAARVEAEAARAEAEAASKTKSEFLATMSHELRTPLNAVLGYTGLLADGITGPVTEDQRRQLGRIDASARHLLALIEEVLGFAKLEAGREPVRVETVDVVALTREVAELVRPVAETQGLALHVELAEAALPLQGDAKKLRQILLNLLGNAVRYTERGEVRVSLRRDAGRLRWDVRDTGIGIAPEQQGRIFEAFYQVDQSLTRRRDGTGLGLSVTRQLAELLGGEVAVESAVGVGSTFTVWLPARRATDAVPEVRSLEVRPARGSLGVES